MTPRVTISPEASAVISQLKERFGELMFHQSGGCCDGSQPMCFEKGDFNYTEHRKVPIRIVNGLTTSEDTES